MTSVFSRARKYKARYISSEFPPKLFLHRIARVKSPRQLGFFSIDKVTIAMGKFRHEELPGKKCGSEMQFKDEEKTEFSGYMHYKVLDGRTYQVFQGKGIKNVQFNPRHFRSWMEFEKFVQRVANGREFHLTRVDFCWSLSKKLFSVAIIDWILWVKKLGIGERRRYRNGVLELTDRGSFHSLIFGGVPVRLSIYDCDAFNLNCGRDDEKKTHNSINFEVMCRTKELRALGIRSLDDLARLSHTHLVAVLRRFNIYRPLPFDLRANGLDWLQPIWESSGLTEAAREYLSRTNTKDYAPMARCLTELSIHGTSFKSFLIGLAVEDFSAFFQGRAAMNNSGDQRIAYAMKPIFYSARLPR